MLGSDKQLYFDYLKIHD